MVRVTLHQTLELSLHDLTFGPMPRNIENK